MFKRGDVVELTPGAKDWVENWNESIGRVMIVTVDQQFDSFTGKWLFPPRDTTGGGGYGARFFKLIGHIDLDAA